MMMRPVARAQIDDVIALLHFRHAQHALDDLHRRLHVRHVPSSQPQLLRLSICGRGSKRQQQKSFQEIHQAILSNGPPS